MAPEAGFEFGQPLWLLGLLLPLAAWFLWRRRAQQRREEESRWRSYADAHLLQYLLLQEGETESRRRRMLLWALLWCLGVLAMAGPRWDYREVSSYEPGVHLVVLLDLSTSMNVGDAAPTRLARARQEIEDLLRAGDGLRVGLIAFASVAHVVAPVTDDADTILHLLPSLSTDLVRYPGSRLSNALARAGQLLSGQPAEGSKAILLISDGDFAEADLLGQVKKLSQAGVKLDVIGVGTPEGGQVPLPGGQPGYMVDAGGQPVISKLDEAGLQALAEAGRGIYRRASYRDDDTQAIMEQLLQSGSPSALEAGAQRIWNERYYLLVLLMLALMAPWMRRAVRGWVKA